MHDIERKEFESWVQLQVLCTGKVEHIFVTQSNCAKHWASLCFGEIDPCSQSQRTFFSFFPIFAVKLWHFINNEFSLYVTNTQA